MASALFPDTQLSQAARAVGTPFYAFSAEALRNRVIAIKAALPMADFLYSLKANPNVSLIRLLSREGMGVEVCSMYELEACLVAGVSPSDILFVGPAKSRAELTRAVQLRVHAIALESLSEIDMLAQVCADLSMHQNVALRINPAFHVPGARLAMSGKATQFGIDAEDLDAALARVARSPRLHLRGLHVYMGTRILDHQVIVENSRQILDLAEEVMAKSGQSLEFVDIGGGWGVAYAETETPLDLAALGADLRPVLTAWQARHTTTRLIVELGRFVVAEAGVFVTAVRHVKTARGKAFAICDGGTNCHSAAGQAASYRRNFPIRALSPRGGEPAAWMISGPLCTPTDIIAQDALLPPLAVGDLLCMAQSGAYGLTASPTRFLSFGAPAELLIDGTTITVIRERDGLSDLLARQSPRTLAFPEPATEPTSSLEKV